MTWYGGRLWISFVSLVLLNVHSLPSTRRFLSYVPIIMHQPWLGIKSTASCLAAKCHSHWSTVAGSHILSRTYCKHRINVQNDTDKRLGWNSVFTPMYTLADKEETKDPHGNMHFIHSTIYDYSSTITRHMHNQPDFASRSRSAHCSHVKSHLYVEWPSSRASKTKLCRAPILYCVRHVTLTPSLTLIFASAWNQLPKWFWYHYLT